MFIFKLYLKFYLEFSWMDPLLLFSFLLSLLSRFSHEKTASFFSKDRNFFKLLAHGPSHALYWQLFSEQFFLFLFLQKSFNLLGVVFRLAWNAADENEQNPSKNCFNFFKAKRLNSIISMICIFLSFRKKGKND